MDARARAWITGKGGTLPDHEVPQGDARYIWVRCAAGHEWLAWKENMAGRRSWCPECYGNKPLTIEIMRGVAEARGGVCVSPVYAGPRHHLGWRCASGHEWEATPNNVKNHGSWCPHCRVNIGEELVRAALREAFPEKEFERTRREPWMEGLELDGYNEELRLAFEYQGRQHYERVKHFQQEDGDFEAQQERDALTEERCQDEFVTLLVIPHTIGFRAIRGHVRRELEVLGYTLADPAGTDGEFYDRVRALGSSKERQFQRIVEVISKKGGECISTQYAGYRVPLMIRCKAGHDFEATPEAIDQPASRGPRFCPECGGTRRRADDELRAKVEACGYAYLGVESRPAGGRTRRYIRVQCPAGHEYETLWDNFCPKAGVPKKGCAACHHVRLGASKRIDIRQWESRTGIVHEGQYTAAATQCNWRCAAGHTFSAKLTVLKEKAEPCTECAIAKIADARGLVLMTAWTKHSGPTTELTWQCVECGAEFTASLAAMSRKKSFCPNGCS